MPPLILTTGVIAMYEKFHFTDADWKRFLGARITSLRERHDDSPSGLDIQEMDGIAVDNAVKTRVRRLFNEIVAMHTVAK